MVLYAEKMPTGSTLLELSTKETFLPNDLNYISLVGPSSSPYYTDCISTEDAIEDSLTEVSVSNNNKQDFYKQPAKKRVSFADSVGLELVQVRHLTAGRDTPPILHPKVFESLNIGRDKPDIPTLRLGFQQPVTDYYRFRLSLEKNKVSLESVSINDATLTGTVKVKNLAYHKTVVARVTYDNWVTTEDINAYHINNGLVNGQGNPISSVIDTFCFTHEISVDRLTHPSVQFVICYTCEGQEFWDNNDAKNYSIEVENLTNMNNNFTLLCHNYGFKKCHTHQMENWTEFAIWKSLESDYTPYW